MDLRLYHLYSTNYNEEIKIDCKVLKLVYDTYPSGTRINRKNVSFLVRKVGIPEDELTRSLQRIFNLYHLHIPQAFEFVFPKGFCRVFFKDFHLDIEGF